MARVLTRDEALAVVNRWDLKGTWAAKARNLVSLLDMDGQVALTAVQAALFQGKEWDSMVKTLQRRVDRFNGAARAVHSAATVVMTGKTEDDVVRFESQEVDAPGEPRLLEYEAAQKKGIVIEDVRSFDLAPVYAETDDPRPIVLLTFNRHETAAILKAFCPDGAPARKLRHGVPYYDLGEAAGRRVVLTVSRQGVSRAQQAAEEACEAWSPQALIGVGIAFGVDRNEQRIGDVLVSQSTQEYDLGRVNPDGTVTPRGGEAEASDSWVRAILMADHVARARGCPWPKLRFGCLLSGSKLVDSLSYRDSLLELYRNRQVVGGEMEALGLARVSQRAYRQAQNVAWIVVKGICDFADGDVNNPFKQANQKVAAAHAARVVYSVLTDRFLDTPLETAPDGECPNEPKLTDFRSVAAELFQSMPVEPLAVDKTAEPPAQRRGTSADKVALEQMLRWADDDGGTPLFALLGEVGIGKTVTCQAFAHALRERRRHDQTTRWPLYFDLREASLPKGRVPSVDRIMKECARNGWYRSESKVKVADIWRWIYQGGVVIFDGLDEVLNKLDDDEGKKLTNRLLSVVNEAQARGTGGRPPKVVVSSRTQFFRTLRDERNRLTGGLANDKTAASFEAWLILPLSEEQVSAYLKAALPGHDVDRLEKMLSEVHDLTDLSQRPFTLGLVVDAIPQIEAWRAEGKPIFGSTLYREFARQWLDRDKEKDKIETRHKYVLVEHLAAHMWRNDLTSVPVDDLEDWFRDWRQGQRGWADYEKLGPDKLNEALRNATFLSRVDKTANDGAFRFAHTSLQEFFLSEYL
ncbi:MAG: NACHT domain-containing protein, partial [Propionibacteriaceae bacterium]|nr:NACHT domain-containing protein [Propionibacteriaceae bacterium]